MFDDRYLPTTFAFQALFYNRLCYLFIMPQRKSLAPILAVNFVGTLGFSIVVPFLVFLVSQWGGNPIIYGLVGATYSAFQLVGAPVLGRWSDRVGRRKILLLSQLGTLFSWCVFLVAFFIPAAVIAEVDSGLLGEFTLTVPLILLFVARALDGLTGGNVSVANAYLADITEEAERSSNFGKMAVAGNLGFVLGPALAGVLGATVFGELLPVSAALLISAVASLIIVFALEDRAPCRVELAPVRRSMRKTFGQEHKECYEIANGSLPFREVLRLRYVAPVLLVYFLVMLGFSFFYVGFPAHAVTALEWSVTDTGAYFAFLSLVMVVVQGPVLTRLAKTTTDRTLIVWGTVVLAAGFCGLAADSTVFLYLAAGAIAVGNGLMWPSVLALLSRTGDATTQGAIQGAGGTVGAIASIVGLALAGLLYEVMSSGVFLLGAGVVIPVAAIVGTTCRKL